MNLVQADTGEIVGQAGDQTLALMDGNFNFLPTGLVVVGEPTFQQCEEAVKQIHFVGKMAPVWLGDLLNYMENRWGEGYAQVLDATGFAYQTVANAKSIMGRVPLEVRQDGLTFTHYALVASSSHSDQERLLEKAKDEELNTSEFTRVVRREKRQTAQGKLPEKVKMEMTAVFEVPADLKGKLRDLAEGWASRLWEWDIECKDLSIREGE